MKNSGPPQERETLIRWSDTDDDAELYTSSATYYRRMLKRGFIPKEDGERHALFVFPKKRVKLPSVGKSKRGFGTTKAKVATGKVVSLLP